MTVKGTKQGAAFIKGLYDLALDRGEDIEQYEYKILDEKEEEE